MLQPRLFDPGEEDPPWRLPFEATEKTYHGGEGLVRNFTPGSMLHSGTIAAASIGKNRAHLSELVHTEYAEIPKTVVSSDRAANMAAGMEDRSRGASRRHIPAGDLADVEVRGPERAWMMRVGLTEGKHIPYVNESEDLGSISLVGRADTLTSRHQLLHDNEDDLTHGTRLELERYRTLESTSGGRFHRSQAVPINKPRVYQQGSFFPAGETKGEPEWLGPRKLESALDRISPARQEHGIAATGVGARPWKK